MPQYFDANICSAKCYTSDYKGVLFVGDGVEREKATNEEDFPNT
jgi:hypothetical protein